MSSFIDRDGNVTDGLPRVLHRFLSAMRLEELRAYAVSNMGFVEIRDAPYGLLVKMRPDVISGATYAALMAILFDRGRSRIALIHLGDTWQQEILVNRFVAMNRVTELVQHALAPSPGEVYSQELNLANVPTKDPFWSLVIDWTHWRRSADMGRLIDATSGRTGGRYVLFVLDRARGRFLFDQVGPGLPKWAQLVLPSAKGCPIDEWHDRRFGSHAAVSYKDAALSDRPRLEAVDAVIAWPRLGPMRRRYRRLLLPCTDGQRRQLLLSATLDDPRIDLRRGSAVGE